MEYLKLILVLFFLLMSILLVTIGYVATTNSCPRTLNFSTRLGGFIAFLVGCYGCFIIYQSVEFTTKIQF